jgi:hypothetical protein
LRFSRIPGWSDFTRSVTTKTFYLATVILAIGIALIGIALSVHGLAQVLLLALGSTLATSSVYSVISEAMLRLDTLELIKGEFDNLRVQVGLLATQGGNDGSRQIKNRREIDFAEFVSAAKKWLKVIAFSANDLLSAPNCDRIYEALNTGRLDSVQVLLLDPNSSAARTRSSAPAYHSLTSLRDKTRAVVNELEELRTRLSRIGRGDAISWWFVSEPITVSLVADQNTAIVTPIVRTHTGGTSPTFIFDRRSRGEEFYEVYLEYFESLLADYGRS